MKSFEGIRVTLYTNEGCHLCEQAEQILDYVGVGFKAIDISRISSYLGVTAFGSSYQRDGGRELGWPFDSFDVERWLDVIAD